MASLPRYRVLDPQLPRLPRAELRRLQAERLRAMVRYVYDETPFWRRKLDAAGLRPDAVRGLDDVVRIPFCTKAELQADQEVHPPFGSYVATDRTHWARFLTTSGTTGRPLKRVFSQRDWDQVLDRFARNPTQGPGDVVMVLGPIDGLMGPTAGREASERMGALVVLAGLYDTRGKIALLQEVRPTSVSGTASYLLHLAEVARQLGVDVGACGVRSLASAGEPGAAIATTRARLSAAWGGARVNDGYGLTELFPLGGSCPHSTSLHIHGDLALTEVVDPTMGVPLAPGEPGELVFTNLVGDTQPLLRYRSRDVGRIVDDEPCACGFTGPRIVRSIEARVDDMIWYRGSNLFPSAIEAVVYSIAELGAEFQIVLEQEGALPTLTVVVERAPTDSSKPDGALADRVAEGLSAIRLRAAVRVVPFGSLPRGDGRTKARRVVDRRPASAAVGPPDP